MKDGRENVRKNGCEGMGREYQRNEGEGEITTTDTRGGGEGWRGKEYGKVGGENGRMSPRGHHKAWELLRATQAKGQQRRSFNWGRSDPPVRNGHP